MWLRATLNPVRLFTTFHVREEFLHFTSINMLKKSLHDTYQWSKVYIQRFVNSNLVISFLYRFSLMYLELFIEPDFFKISIHARKKNRILCHVLEIERTYELWYWLITMETKISFFVFFFKKSKYAIFANDNKNWIRYLWIQKLQNLGEKSFMIYMMSFFEKLFWLFAKYWIFYTNDALWLQSAIHICLAVLFSKCREFVVCENILHSTYLLYFKNS